MSTFTPSAEQAAIIDAPVDADVLVVAGAGSGKTFTIPNASSRLSIEVWHLNASLA